MSVKRKFVNVENLPLRQNHVETVKDDVNSRSSKSRSQVNWPESSQRQIQESNNTSQSSQMGHTIEEVESSTFMGITIDSYLTWTNHIDKIYNKLIKVRYALSRLHQTASV
ncbi:unnamed protein product [Leptidea sinapis]|uniref:Uncharacterized protein n=1 Tax=Leptidea sinapis TaxID=189913 RepID=A0A5E4Q252_9NEOP|nr:unnamed protein product [Leptidea sinapis]